MKLVEVGVGTCLLLILIDISIMANIVAVTKSNNNITHHQTLLNNEHTSVKTSVSASTSNNNSNNQSDTLIRTRPHQRLIKKRSSGGEESDKLIVSDFDKSDSVENDDDHQTGNSIWKYSVNNNNNGGGQQNNRYPHLSYDTVTTRTTATTTEDPIFNNLPTNDGDDDDDELSRTPHTKVARSDSSSDPSQSIYHVEFKTAYVDGLRVEAVEKGVSYEDQGVSIVLADTSTSIRLFGHSFTNHTIVRFSRENKARGDDCDDTSSTKTYALTDIHNVTAVVNVIFSASKQDEYYFLCVRENDTEMYWVHQGPDPWLRVKAYDRLLPFWIQAVFIGLLLLLSGLFAGLTLGLLALDTTDLKILANTGSETERIYAKTILPLRTRGNYLLCSLVLGNVLVNSTLTILLDDLTTGVFAVMLSTAGIVVVGEIIPQAVCSRNGLAIGAKTVWVTKFIMIITFPLSYTFSVLLDKILGEEIGIVYNREKLKELIAVTLEHNQLETDEVNIISGALEMRVKTVEAIMTRLEDVFMLPIDGVLDFESLSEIRKQGYSRIPVYENERSNIVSLLFTKDLVFVDPDDRIQIKTLAHFYSNICYFIFSDTTLDVVFKEFKECKRGGHMAFVQRVNTSREDKDPYNETIGLVTLEDVIEEMIQSEIVDETDVWMDNRSKKRMPIHQKQDFSKFVEIRNSQKTICISPQLALAAFQFLSTVVEPFNRNLISESVLHRLLKKNILFRIIKSKDKSNVLIYEKDKPTDSFTLVLEGRVEVVTGQENLVFESGPFSYFGVAALLSDGEIPFVPDYTVKLVTDVIILKVRRSLYKAALQATTLEKSKTIVDSNGSDVHVDPSVEEQIDRVLRTVDSESQLQPNVAAAADTASNAEAKVLPNSLSNLYNFKEDSNV